MSEFDSTEQILESIKLLKNKLDLISEDLPDVVDDYHKLFVYFIGNLFEAIPPQEIMEQGLICDQKGEHGIDLYFADERRFVVYQCKLPELDLMEKDVQLPKYGPDIVNEAEDALTFITDDEGKAKGNKYSQYARTRYRQTRDYCKQDKRECKLEIVLAYFGELTKPAKDKLEELRGIWEKDIDEFEIKTINYDHISSELRLSFISPARPKRIKLEYKPKTEVHTNDWGYALVPAVQFFSLFEEYKMGLFDLNVRSHLGRTLVNKEIQRTLDTTKGQRDFHLLNNGITISCKGWTPNTANNCIELHHPQIINGCQTVISIYRSYSQMDKEYNRRNLEEKCFVPVRFIQTQDAELLDNIITASNFQNEMSTRNLRANSREQRLLQNQFLQLKPSWFYERKDGEFDSLREYHTSGFKIKLYQFAHKQWRKISNEDLAKAWLSFIGFSTFASEKIYAFDLVGDGGKYEWLFQKRPTPVHWNAITLGPEAQFIDDNFEPFSPTPEQYLLSYIIYEFIKAYLPTHHLNKTSCNQRLMNSGKITDKSSAEDINKAMMGDNEYVRNQILLNMKEVIVEMYSWILCKTYGPLVEDTAKKLLKLKGFSDLFQAPDFKTYVIELKEADSHKKDNILYTCFEFTREAVKRWQNIHAVDYLASQRRIRYLHSSTTIESMKTFLDETNEQTREVVYLWKPEGKKFLESLPSLEG